MSLFEQMVENQSSRTRDLCTVARVRSELDEPDRADLDRALEETAGGTYRLTGVTIAESLQRLLGDRAHGIKGATVQRHRRGICSCGDAR